MPAVRQCHRRKRTVRKRGHHDRWPFRLALVLLAGAALLLGVPSDAADVPRTDEAWRAKVHPRVVADTAAGQRVSAVVLLADRADLSAAALLTEADARGEYVYRALTAHATRSQAPLRRWLEARGVRYRAFWAANML